MRVVFITPSLGDAYGQERILRESSELLRDEGVEIHFVGGNQVGPIPPSKSSLLIDGLNQINTLTPFATVTKVMSQLKTHLTEIKPDIIHFIDQFDHRIMNCISQRFPTLLTAHTVAPTCPSSQRYISNGGGACEKQSGWKCLFQHLSYDCLQHFKTPLHQAHAIFEFQSKRKALNLFSGIAAISDYVKNTLIQDGFVKEKVEVICNPVWIDTHALNPASSAPENLFVVASRLVKLKGIDFLLKDLNRIRDLKWTLWIFGEGPERKHLENLTRELNLANRVVFKGRKDSREIYQAMLASVAFIQPNRGPEGFGMAAAEASFLGVPVVCYDVPALNEFIYHQKTGFLSPLHSQNGLAAALKEILKDLSRAKKMGEEGSRRIKSEYSKERHLQQTITAYEKCKNTFQSTGLVSPIETFSLNPNDIQETF